MRQLSFKRHRFPADIIRHSVWLYARFTLSYRDVEEMLAERGLDVSYETVRRWLLKFGSTIAANLSRTRPRPGDHWRLDESAPRRREGGAMSYASPKQPCCTGDEGMAPRRRRSGAGSKPPQAAVVKSDGGDR